MQDPFCIREILNLIKNSNRIYTVSKKKKRIIAKVTFVSALRSIVWKNTVSVLRWVEIVHPNAHVLNVIISLLFRVKLLNEIIKLRNQFEKLRIMFRNSYKKFKLNYLMY